eukprot:UN02367
MKLLQERKQQTLGHNPFTQKKQPQQQQTKIHYKKIQMHHNDHMILLLNLFNIHLLQYNMQML